ncbi:LOW QUALITY PROTEIN: putative histidinol dehydrogenase [Limimaricola cinnabarinus LL-001]|uniref:Histidinol dehydrogenase homolog n=1 Tax=Limimaricola cinnabarinus LL-001 TaxID=1337093 RepID=U2Z5E2_9RHOB|nr:LOW QUALITY PROTEIN: putative histidinol dehydrogenase [Limimaricola cinnabarinus LL-001]
MTVTHLKTAKRHAESDQADTRAAVSAMLAEIKSGGEPRVEAYARDLDHWDGPVLVDAETRRAAADRLPESLKEDIRFAHANIRRFAEAQMRTVQDCEVEILPGIAGQRQIPVSAAGCYVPGGRYSHIASALMTITTAKVAGVGHITACSPTRPGEGIPAAILFAMDLCGADAILNLGGVQGVAAMADGLYGLPRADILVGPGNQYVAEAKRILFGEIGIDMFAGPTDSMVLADETADPEIVAIDLVSQAEHGWNSPVWLATTDRALAEKVMEIVPGLIDALPEPNASSARAAWADFAEVMLCDSREAMAQIADDYAPEHLHVQAADLDWWLNRLRAYGSLFLGEETTVAYGDKASGPNHVLPTSGAARYTGGLSVHKFMKTVTWQRADRAASRRLGGATARISRVEGMEGHARAADIRLIRYAVTEPSPASAKVAG